eukprot:g26910.t1
MDSEGSDQAEEAAGKLRFGDPRGHSPPFGRSFFHSPRSGDLVFFPSWLSHMATVTAPQTDPDSNGTPPLRVVFSFNIGPVQGPMPCCSRRHDQIPNPVLY